MESPTRSASVDDSDTIPLTSKPKFRFYEPLILLVALNLELRNAANYISPSEVCNTMDPEELFKATINKLAMVCDSSRGGATVTAIWVSDNEAGQVEYHIASNQRKPAELVTLTTFVTTLLREVRAVSSPYQAIRTLLPRILNFDRPRINIYLEELRTQAQKCLAKCAELENENDDIIAPELRALLGVCSTERVSTLPEPDYIRCCQTVIQCLIRLVNSIAGTHIDHRGREARESSHEDCWSELRHYINRLLGYRQSVAFFLRAKTVFPRLFAASVVVSTLPSSRPLSKPLVRNKSLTADSIVGRLTSEKRVIETFRAFVRDLQLFDLDARIRTEFTRSGFRPVVHAEVLLLNHIEFSEGGIDGSRFFGGWMYIGCSKPACKLCSYYFEDHDSDVGYRSSHGNLYTSWRLPDVRKDQGPAALRKRGEMQDKVLKRVREDAFNLVERKAVPTHRSHDSVTLSARLTLEDRFSAASQADDLASTLGRMGVEDGDDDSFDDDDFGEIGGARL